MPKSEIDRITVVGAGTMGHGIAQVAALAGIEVTLHDVDPDALDSGLSKLESNLAGGVDKGKLSRDEADAARERVRTSTDLSAAVSAADLIIEAAPENMALKKKIFGEVAAAAGSDAILASNTSSLSIDEIAASLPAPERFLGMHFFNPPYVLRLLELIVGEETSEGTLSRVRAAGERMGREMITVKDSPGFATSRLGLVLGLEAMRMLETGVASAEDIDRAMELGYRHPMGPLKLTDLVGLDVRLAISEHLHRELGSEAFRPPAILRRLVDQGKLGKKSGEGFYRWDG